MNYFTLHFDRVNILRQSSIVTPRSNPRQAVLEVFSFEKNFELAQVTRKHIFKELHSSLSEQLFKSISLSRCKIELYGNEDIK